MITVVQSLDGVDFNGTGAGMGRIDFSQIPDLPPVSQFYVPTLVHVALEVAGDGEQLQNLASADCFLKPADEPIGTRLRLTIAREVNVPGFAFLGCGIPVPRSVDGDPNPTYTPWQLILVTSGMQAVGVANWIVSFRTTPV